MGISLLGRKTGLHVVHKGAERVGEEVWREHERLVLVIGRSCFPGPHIGEKVSHTDHPVLLSTSQHLEKSNLTKRDWPKMEQQLCLGPGVGHTVCGFVPSGALPRPHLYSL